MRWQFGGHGRPPDRGGDREVFRQAGYTEEQIATMLPVEPGESAGGEVIELLEEDLPVWELWCSLRTQWRVGMAGATGLDYAVLQPAYYRQFGIRKRDRRDAFSKLREMEAEALRIMTERAESKKS